MTSVLKTESAAGESYDSLFDGAKSLVTGLGSLLRVVSHEASVSDSHSPGKSKIKASFITADERLSRKGWRLAFRSRTSYSRARRSERDASDAQLQVNQIRVTCSKPTLLEDFILNVFFHFRCSVKETFVGS